MPRSAAAQKVLEAMSSAQVALDEYRADFTSDTGFAKLIGHHELKKLIHQYEQFIDSSYKMLLDHGLI